MIQTKVYLSEMGVFFHSCLLTIISTDWSKLYSILTYLLQTDEDKSKDGESKPAE